MNKNPLKQGEVIEKSAGVGTVTREMVWQRGRELAVINGRSAADVLKADLPQARWELTGRSGLDPKTELLEAASESERWDPLPGSEGRKAPINASEDEDEEGRSDDQQLTEEGLAEAEHDQMLQAAKVAIKSL